MSQEEGGKGPEGFRGFVRRAVQGEKARIKAAFVTLGQELKEGAQKYDAPVSPRRPRRVKEPVIPAWVTEQEGLVQPGEGLIWSEHIWPGHRMLHLPSSAHLGSGMLISNGRVAMDRDRLADNLVDYMSTAGPQIKHILEFMDISGDGIHAEIRIGRQDRLNRMVYVVASGCVLACDPEISGVRLLTDPKAQETDLNGQLITRSNAGLPEGPAPTI